MKHCVIGFAALLSLVVSNANAQQPVDDSHSHVPFDQPDAWAMAYVISSTLLTGFGETPALESGNWLFSAELGHIPRLSRAEQRVGLNGTKEEDLNKSPVFGRGRVWVGLPYGFVAELAYTPPIELEGAKPQDLFALGFGRRLIDRPAWSLSGRVHGQHGSAKGDVTCSADIAGSEDPEVNPFGCLEPSKDVIKLRYYAAELTSGFGAADSNWRGHATLGVARFEPRVNIHAEYPVYSNRTVITASGTRPYVAAGLTYDTHTAWEWAGEALYVPLRINRPEEDLSSESFWSLRLMLRYRFDQPL